MKYLIALDQGTTSSRTILFNKDGTPERIAQQEFTQHFPQPGWVEHDAEEIWATQKKTLQEALAGISENDLIGIGITNQRETVLLWDRKTGKPLGPAIVWQDRRTASQCRKLKEAGKEPLFKEKCGLVIDPYFSGTKIQWMLEHYEGAMERACTGELAVGTIDSWLVWNLTGGEKHVTDASNASRTLLFNINTMAWDDKLLTLLNIPKEILPQVVDSSGVCGQTCAEGIPHGITIAGIAGDQQAALFGQACFEKGMAKNTYGTGCFLLMNVGTSPQLSNNNLLTTVAWRIQGETHYALEGSVFIAGAIVQWLRDGLGIIKDSSEIEALAAEVDSSDGVFFVPALAGLGAPYWDPNARGTIVGITRGTTKAHIAHAALDAIAFRSAELLEAMQHDAEQPLSHLKVDGGASVNNLLMQRQADLIQVSTTRPKVVETTAWGAASLAGLALKVWDNVGVLANEWQADQSYSPQISTEQSKNEVKDWKKAVQRSLDWA